MDKTKVVNKVHQIFAQYIRKDFTNQDDFFKLGGHSLDIVQVVLQVEREFGIKISDVEAKNLRTVEAIASFVAKKLG
jgi:acyl carrier protein